MDIISPSVIKELLAKHAAAPSKRLGQNFLIDGRILEKIIAAAELSSQDTVLEIGPGIGTLTRALAEKAGNVIAIEKDRAMVEILQETLAGFNNVEVVQGNALEISNFKFQISNYKLVANIPYYITSPIIRKFLEEKHQPTIMVLMVQKEVAKRICAKPPDMSILALSVQFYATPKVISYVSKNCFWPAPNVDSAIISITPHKEKSTIDPEIFFTLVKAGFSAPRKQLAGNLSKALKKDKEAISAWLLKNNIDAKRRAETLSLQDWKNLTSSYGEIIVNL